MEHALVVIYHKFRYKIGSLHMAKKIKLSFISFLAYPLFDPGVDAVFGGAEIDLYNLARKFSQTGDYDVTFYVGDFGQQQEEMHGSIRVKKIRYLNLERYRGNHHKLLRQLNILKEVAAMDCDVCMIEAYNEMLGWVAMLPGKLRNTKVLFRLAHELDTDFADSRAKGYLNYRLYKYGIYRAGAVVSQTEIQKKMLKENLGIDSKVIKNCFFIDPKVGFDDKDHILWVARAQEWKRPHIFLELAGRLPERRFVMVMPGNNELQSKIRQEAAKIPNLRFVDHVPFNEIQSWYDAAELFVNTSEYEGFPNAFVQSCLGRTPILSFNVDPDSFIEENGLGFFCNEDMDQAVSFIRGLTRERLAEMGENAGKYARENHDIDVIYKVYEEMIVGLVNDKKSR